MEFDASQVSGVGFPEAKNVELMRFNQDLNKYLKDRSYSSEVQRLGAVFVIYPLEHQRPMPKPRLAKAKTYRAADVPGFPKDWPDRHVPVSLEIKFYVDYETAAATSGIALRHAFVDPLCQTLLQTPKTVQRQIDIQRLITDLRAWAQASD